MIDPTKTTPEKLAEMNDSLLVDNTHLRLRVKALNAELELERMRLAACGVVAMANTPESAAKAREMKPEYRSASCGDVAAAVDREMRYRAALNEVGNWLVCACIASAEDMAQSFPHMQSVVELALNPHTLWETGEPGVPEAILGRNNEVVLGLCKVCGRGECELDEPCAPRVLK